VVRPPDSASPGPRCVDTADGELLGANKSADTSALNVDEEEEEDEDDGGPTCPVSPVPPP